MRDSVLILATGGPISTVLSFLVFLFFGIWYYNGLTGWCADYVKAGINQPCYPIIPPGGYYGSWQFSYSVSFAIAAFGLTFLSWFLLNRRESSRKHLDRATIKSR